MTRKPSQPRDMQFTTEVPRLPKDASAEMVQWQNDFVERLKSDHQTIEDAFAKLKERVEALEAAAAAPLD